MKVLYTKQCADCHKVFRTDNENAKACPSCQDMRDYMSGRKKPRKRKKQTLSIRAVMRIGRVCDKVNGTNLAHHYGDIVKRIENTNADRCVCCGEIIPEGRMICIKCEKAGGEK